MRKDKIIAATVTVMAALLIVLLLLFAKMSTGRHALAEASVPEPDEPELIYLEPQLMPLEMQDPGVEEAAEPAPEPPMPEGTPDPAPVEQPEMTQPGRNPEPAPVREQQNTQRKPSPARRQDNAISDEDARRLKGMSAMRGENGHPQGSDSPVAGKGKTSAKGSLRGRTFGGCPTEAVDIDTRSVTVTVSVKVNAEGKVTSARATSGPRKYRAQCERWARRATWSAKPGAPLESGTITFTIRL